MRGSVVKRGNTWSYVVDIGRDPRSGRRRQQWRGGCLVIAKNGGKSSSSTSRDRRVGSDPRRRGVPEIRIGMESGVREDRPETIDRRGHGFSYTF
jgi:hypothetical protein